MDMIDAYVERLDGIWETQKYDESALADLLERLCGELDPLVEQLQAIQIELCASDMEWRWSSSRQFPSVSNASEPPNEEELTTLYTDSDPTTCLPKRPAATDYRHLLAEVWESDIWRRKLQLAEWKTRSAVGDQPSLKSFMIQYPEWEKDKRKLVSALDDVARTQVSVFLDGKKALAYRAPAKFMLGRQHMDEPPPPAWIAESKKLVVATLEDLRVSRKQVQLRRTQAFEFVVSNVSKKVSIDIDCRRVKPHQSVRLTTPIRIAFDNVAVTVEARPA